jgi:hypothetical protein
MVCEALEGQERCVGWAREDRRPKQKILAAHGEAKGCYGTPRIEQELGR